MAEQRVLSQLLLRVQALDAHGRSHEKEGVEAKAHDDHYQVPSRMRSLGDHWREEQHGSGPPHCLLPSRMQSLGVHWREGEQEGEGEATLHHYLPPFRMQSLGDHWRKGEPEEEEEE